VKNELIKRFGEQHVSDVPVKEGEIPLLLIDLDLGSKVRVLVTNGLHEYKMPVPESEIGKEFNEIYFCLPSYWEPEDLENPRMNWIYYWIQRIAKYVQEKEMWFGHGHTMPCGKDAQPLSETMKQNYFMLTDPILLEQQLLPILVEEKEVRFLAIMPIFEKEFTYKRGKTTRKLMKRFSANRVDEKLDDFRENVMRSRIFHRR
jgi:hypothetical protein